MLFSKGDVIKAKEAIWSPFLGKYIKAGKVIVIEDLDDAIMLPSPHKWIKI